MELLRRSTPVHAWRAPHLLLPTVLPARYAAAGDLHTYERSRRSAFGDVCESVVSGAAAYLAAAA